MEEKQADLRKNSKVIKIMNADSNNNTNKSNNDINNNNDSNKNNHNNKIVNFLHIDDLDLKILGLLTTGNDNKLIANNLSTPLSTIQRRTRKLFEKELLSSKIELNYNKLGLKTGFIHVYLSNGNLDKIGQQIANRKGISCVSVHVGNSDLVCTYICQSSDDLITILSEIKSIEGVDRVVWSEEVYRIASTSKNSQVIPLKY
jgi:DNA-binding Lrp family transcriptional regulator